MKPEQISLFDLISSFFKYVHKRILLISSLFLVCILCTVLIHVKSDDEYVTNMRVISNETPFHISESLIQPIQKAIKISNFSALENWLEFSPGELNSLNSLEVSEIKSTIPYEKSENCIMEFEVRGSDKEIFSKLEPAFINYLNNNNYIKIQNEANRAEYESIIRESDAQLIILDSIQKAVSNEALRKDDPRLENLDLGSLYMQKVEIKTIQEAMRRKLNVIDEYKVIAGFSNFEKTKGIIYWLAIGVIGGIILNLLIGSVFFWNYLKDLLSED